MDQNYLRSSFSSHNTMDQGLPPISPAAPFDSKQDFNTQALQQLLANNAAAQRYLLLNSLSNPLTGSLLANSFSNPLLQAQLVANAALMGVANPLSQGPFGQLGQADQATLASSFQNPNMFQSQNHVNPNIKPLNASNGGQPFMFQNPNFFEFGSDDSRQQRKKAQRKRPIKMAQSTDANAHSRANAALARPRDEDGRFAPTKVQKTDTLDLRLKLDTKQDEVAKLREQIQQRDQLVSQLQQQLQDLAAENERQRSTLYSLSDTDQLRLFHDARFIREFKARQQYLHEIEMAAQQRLAAILAKTEEVRLKSAANTPSSTPQQSTPLTVGTPIQMDITTNPGSSETHQSTPQSAASEEHDSIEHMIMSPPASWMEEPWNQEIPRPFREKIDLTKIELKPVEPPPNLVENARMEYWEGQRRWQQQQAHVQKHMAQLGYSPMQGPPRGLHGPPRYTPLPAYAEKIDLAEKVAQLRKTTSSSHVPAVPSSSNKMDEEGMQLIGMGGLLSMENHGDPMITDEMNSNPQLFGDSIDFLQNHDELDFGSSS